MIKFYRNDLVVVVVRSRCSLSCIARDIIFEIHHSSPLPALFSGFFFLSGFILDIVNFLRAFYNLSKADDEHSGLFYVLCSVFWACRRRYLSFSRYILYILFFLLSFHFSGNKKRTSLTKAILFRTTFKLSEEKYDNKRFGTTITNRRSLHLEDVFITRTCVYKMVVRLVLFVLNYTHTRRNARCKFKRKVFRGKNS